MNELEFVVEYRTGDQGMFVGAVQPGKEIRHEAWYEVGGRRDMLHFAAAEYAHAAAPELSGGVEQRRHEHPVRREQVVLARGVPLRELVVDLDGVPRFLDFPQGRDDRLAVQKGRNLVLAERIPFDRQRALDGADAVDPPHPQAHRLRDGLRAADGFADLRDQVENGRRDGVWRRGDWHGADTFSGSKSYPKTSSPRNPTAPRYAR